MNPVEPETVGRAGRCAPINAGATSSRRLVERALARIAACSDTLPVMAVLDAEAALDAASRRDAEAPRSPLHGLPVMLKDAIDVAGLPTRGGSRLVDDRPERSATLVRRIEAAGLVVLGKARQQELAFGGWGTHALEGTLRNPWDARVHRVPGGSSSGCAVAVAAGLVSLAVGTDTGGSVRIPASLCGLVGLRPGAAALPLDGVMPLCPGLDSAGPIAGRVAEAAALFQVMAGLPVIGAAPAGLRGLRLGYWDSNALGWLAPDVAAAYRRSLARLRDHGARLEIVQPPADGDELAARVSVLLGYEAWRTWGGRVTAAPERMDPWVRRRFLAGAQVPAAAYRAACRRRVADLEASRAMFAQVDAVVLPTTPMTAVPLAEVDESRTPLARYTRWVNYLDLCAVAVPAGLSPAGLPLSLQFVLPAGREQAALELAAAWEALAPPLPRAPLAVAGP